MNARHCLESIVAVRPSLDLSWPSITDLAHEQPHPGLSRTARAAPAEACDTHCHVFGPSDRFPYAADRSYTPPYAPLAKYLGMLDTLGFERGVLVQGSAHGHDNSAMLDALERTPQRLRGVAVGDESVSIISFAAGNCTTAAA